MKWNYIPCFASEQEIVDRGEPNGNKICLTCTLAAIMRHQYCNRTNPVQQHWNIVLRLSSNLEQGQLYSLTSNKEVERSAKANFKHPLTEITTGKPPIIQY